MAFEEISGTSSRRALPTGELGLGGARCTHFGRTSRPVGSPKLANPPNSGIFGLELAVSPAGGVRGATGAPIGPPLVLLLGHKYQKSRAMSRVPPVGTSASAIR